MITKLAFENRPRGTEYDTPSQHDLQLQLALIHSHEGDRIYEHDVVLVEQPWGLAAYMGVYNQEMTAFEFIALG